MKRPDPAEYDLAKKYVDTAFEMGGGSGEPSYAYACGAIEVQLAWMVSRLPALKEEILRMIDIMEKDK